MKDCLGLAKEFQAKKPDDDNNDGARGRRPPRGNNAFQDHDKVVATIFGGLTATESRRDRKLADFNTAYHAILGRPALAKFMAILHYAYLVLKMPLPAGVLALRANLSIAYAYETESFSLTESTDLSIQMASVVTDGKMVVAEPTNL